LHHPNIHIMIKRLLLVVIAVASFSAAFAQSIQSPEQFLGYKLGEQFTPHYRIVEYFRYVATASKSVKLQQFGSTNEGRPQLAMFIASDENIGRLEEIRHNNLKTGRHGKRHSQPAQCAGYFMAEL
jgi:hypothetical protein